MVCMHHSSVVKGNLLGQGEDIPLLTATSHADQASGLKEFEVIHTELSSEILNL